MLSITVICVGKLKEKYLTDACGEYIKRLTGCCRLVVVEINESPLGDNPSQAEIASALKKEGERILDKIPSGAHVFAMCVEGRELSSAEFSSKLSDVALSGKSRVIFVIGSANGLCDSVKKRADCKLSLSRMTFTHQIARVLLLEQIYRGFQISSGGKYHR